MARHQHLPVIVLCTVVFLLTLPYLFTDSAALSRVVRAADDGADSVKPIRGLEEAEAVLNGLPAGLVGESIAPKLENATLKAELGRANWKSLHTMVARFPENPSPEQRKMLEAYFHLFSFLYPCGDCAKHFRKILKKYPPQTSSRNAAGGWLCFVHNVVNKDLEKPEFDCNKIGDFYDCGCAEEGKDGVDRGKQKGAADKGKKGADEDDELK